MRLTLVIACVIISGCSTTYSTKKVDLDQIRYGATIQNLLTDDKDAVDFSTYTFVYRTRDEKTPRRIKGIESLNGLAVAGQLRDVTSLDAVPGLQDKAAQRSVLGAGIGLAAGLGIGFAVSNRVIIERTALAGGSCATCGGGYIALGSLVSAAIGAAVGAVVAYFGGAGVGSFREATIEYQNGGSQPTSEPTSQSDSRAASDPTK